MHWYEICYFTLLQGTKELEKTESKYPTAPNKLHTPNGLLIWPGITIVDYRADPICYLYMFNYKIEAKIVTAK